MRRSSPPAKEGRVRETAHDVQAGTWPQSRHCTKDAVPRRLRNRITCSFDESAPRMPAASDRLKMLRLPAFSSSRRATTSTSGSGPGRAPRGGGGGGGGGAPPLLLVPPLMLLGDHDEAEVRRGRKQPPPRPDDDV